MILKKKKKSKGKKGRAVLVDCRGGVTAVWPAAGPPAGPGVALSACPLPVAGITCPAGRRVCWHSSFSPGLAPVASTSAPARRCLLGAVVLLCHRLSRHPGSLPAPAGVPWTVVNACGCQAARKSPLDSRARLPRQLSEQICQSSGCLWAAECCRAAWRASCGHRPLGALDLMLVFFRSLYLPNTLNNFSLERVSGCFCAL